MEEGGKGRGWERKCREETGIYYLPNTKVISMFVVTGMQPLAMQAPK